MKTKINPIIPYIGGKRNYYVKLKVMGLIPDYISSKYYEPFCGGCGFALELYNNDVVMPNNIILNDVSTIIDMYEEIRDNTNKFLDALFQIERTKKKFDDIKTNYNEDLYEGTKKQVALCYLHNLSYLGKNMKKEKFGAFYNREIKKQFDGKWRNNALNFAMFLKDAQLSKQDYIDVLNACEEGDFVFMDPPYQNDVKYFNNDMDYECLRVVVDKLTEKNVMVLLILNSSEFMRNKFKDYQQVEIEREGTYLRSTKSVVKELVIYNYTKEWEVSKKQNENKVPDTIELEAVMEEIRLEKKKELKKTLKYRSYWIIIATVLISTQIYNLINFMINWTRIGNDLWHNQPEWPIGTAILLIMNGLSTYIVFYYQNQVFILKSSVINV